MICWGRDVILTVRRNQGSTFDCHNRRMKKRSISVITDFKEGEPGADTEAVNKLLSGDDFNYQCHSNLTRAILPYKLTESDVHDVLNVFQVTGLNKDGKYFMEPSPATKDSYLTFFAETDLLMAMSACPGGDLSVYGWGEESATRMLETCRPLGVEVLKLRDSETVLEGWKESQVVDYGGMHGLKIPVFGEK